VSRSHTRVDLIQLLLPVIINAGFRRFSQKLRLKCALLYQADLVHTLARTRKTGRQKIRHYGASSAHVPPHWPVGIAAMLI